MKAKTHIEIVARTIGARCRTSGSFMTIDDRMTAVSAAPAPRGTDSTGKTVFVNATQIRQLLMRVKLQ